ncbi:hypothetical protein BD413DRAFT_606495 [Trametes elegans]|nr:hypothetical protein BD413DRAFT_606495 [Trametes elegans]
MFQPGYAPIDECADCAPESAAPSLPDCEECAQECDGASCAVELTDQCTDQCVVVPCNDAHHESPACEEILGGAACGKDCLGEVDCSSFDELFRCCNEYHPEQGDFRSYAPDFTSAATYAFMNDPTFDAYFASGSHMQNVPARDPSAFPPLDSTAPTPQLVPSPAFHPSPSPLAQQESSTGVPSPNLSGLPSPVLPTQAQHAPLLQCKWAGCFATFNNLSDLVGHVNLQHLRLPAPQGALSSPYMTPPSLEGQQQQQTTDSSVACLWGDCQLYPSPQTVPGPSSGNNYDVLGFLASHLLQDHLGLAVRPPHHGSIATAPPFGNIPFQNGPSPLSQIPPTSSCSSSSPTSSSVSSTTTLVPEGSPPTPIPEHDCSAPSAHVCKWTGCEKSFTSCDTLTEHIASTHIGSGRAHYDCYWEGCGRNGENGFASKQKISRHMQSHTGHRPFQCTVCQQNFSEAATLAQHMRRHTQEKPYVCDFPGCGKAFAIAGALTIHKRIHNGSKPFKCTYCDRAFSESSNLSKHLRTHTGARPYPCTEPGCSKTFARPDQLARHMNVHKRKAAESAAKAVAAG